MDEAGRIASVTDPYGKTVGYEWGSMGKRTAVLYPDGKKTVYEYNEAMQLTAMKIFSGEMREKMYSDMRSSEQQAERFPRLETWQHQRSSDTIISKITES